jgi:hypothetical protein
MNRNIATKGTDPCSCVKLAPLGTVSGLCIRKVFVQTTSVK